MVCFRREKEKKKEEKKKKKKKKKKQKQTVKYDVIETLPKGHKQQPKS